jgi:hypothetical protein
MIYIYGELIFDQNMYVCIYIYVHIYMYIYIYPYIEFVTVMI